MRTIADGDLLVTKEFGEKMYYCLGCLACTTACPAGVKYPELFEVARAEVESRGVLDNPKRNFIRWFALRFLFSRVWNDANAQRRLGAEVAPASTASRSPKLRNGCGSARSGICGKRKLKLSPRPIQAVTCRLRTDSSRSEMRSMSCIPWFCSPVRTGGSFRAKSKRVVDDRHTFQFHLVARRAMAAARFAPRIE